MKSLRTFSMYPITTRELEVLDAVDVTLGMRRVTLGGANLAAHTAESGYPVQAFRSDGFDDEFKLFLKHPDAEKALYPKQLDGVLDWPRDPHLVSRTYTARRWDADAGRLDIDLVIHGDGPASTWAQSVQVGDTVHIAGPKMSGTHPMGADWCLIAGDETALPAIGRWLEQMPADARAQVFIEVQEESHRQDLTHPAGVNVTYLVRGAIPAGQSTLLLDAVQGAQWWDGTVFAWAAGEAVSLAPLRRWLRRDKALPAEQVEVTGYWRYTPAPADGEDAQVASGAAAQDLHASTEVAGPLIVRTALALGLGEALGGSGATALEAAAACGAHPGAMARLLRYLEAAGLTQRVDERPQGGDDPLEHRRYAWQGPYKEFEDDEEAEAGAITDSHALEELALLGLYRAVKTGRGQDIGAVLEAVGLTQPSADPHADNVNELERHDSSAQYLATPAAQAEIFTQLASKSDATVRVSGVGAGEMARALAVAHPGLNVSVAVEPHLADAMTQRLQGTRVTVDPVSPFDLSPHAVDAHVLVEALAPYPDDAAVALLKAAKSAVTPKDGVVITVGEWLLEEPDDHECEHDLIALAAGRGGLRSVPEAHSLFGRAGLSVQTSQSVGWGFDVSVLR